MLSMMVESASLFDKKTIPHAQDSASSYKLGRSRSLRKMFSELHWKKPTNAENVNKTVEEEIHMKSSKYIKERNMSEVFISNTLSSAPALRLIQRTETKLESNPKIDDQSYDQLRKEQNASVIMAMDKVAEEVARAYVKYNIESIQTPVLAQISTMRSFKSREERFEDELQNEISIIKKQDKEIHDDAALFCNEKEFEKNLFKLMDTAKTIIENRQEQKQKEEETVKNSVKINPLKDILDRKKPKNRAQNWFDNLRSFTFSYERVFILFVVAICLILQLFIWGVWSVFFYTPDEDFVRNDPSQAQIQSNANPISKCLLRDEL